MSPFWVKVGPCLLECEKKDLMHAIISTFGGVLRSKLKREFCRIKVQLNVQKLLCRGTFVTIGSNEKTQIPFKYENLPAFSFGCG